MVIMALILSIFDYQIDVVMSSGSIRLGFLGSDLVATSAAKLAAYDCNATLFRDDIDVHLVNFDPNLDAWKAQQGYCDALHLEGIHMMVGPESSAKSSSIAHFASNLKIPTISYFATAPSLINGNFFARNVLDDTKQAQVMIDFIKFQNWTTYCLISENTNYGAEASIATEQYGMSNRMRLLFSRVYSPVTNITNLLNEAESVSCRIFVLWCSQSNPNTNCIDIMNEANKLNMLEDGRYVWIMGDGAYSNSNLWQDNELRRAMVGTFAILPEVFPSQNKTNFENRIKDIDNTITNIPQKAYFAYDAVYFSCMTLKLVRDDIGFIPPTYNITSTNRNDTCIPSMIVPSDLYESGRTG